MLLTLYGRRRQQGGVDGQQEGQEGLPRLPIHDLGLLDNVLDPAEDTVAEHGLLVDGLGGCWGTRTRS